MDLSELLTRLGPRARDRMIPPQNPDLAQGLPMAVARGVAPNITSMATGEAAPPLQELPAAPGKVPSTNDPRVAGAMPEALNLGLMALGPMGLESRAAAAMPELAARMAPRAAMEAGPANAFLNTASMAAGGVLHPSEAGAAELKPAQQRALEMRRQQEEIRRQSENDRAARERDTAGSRAALERQNAQDQADRELRVRDADARRELETKQASDQYARDQDAAARNAPFREKFPGLTNALPAAGLAAAFLPPALTKAAKQAGANKFASAWQGVVDDASALMDAGGKIPAAQKKILGGQLAAFEAEAPTKLNTTPSLGVTLPGAAIAGDMPLVPMEYDATMLPPDNPNRQSALNTLTNPAELAKRVAPALMMGLPASKLGGGLPSVLPAVRAPAEESKGLAAFFANPPRRATPRQ